MLSVLPALALFPLFDVPQDPPSVLEILPIPHVAAAAVPLTPPPWGTMLRYGRPDDRPDLLFASSDEPPFPIDACVEMVRSMFATEAEGGQLHIQASGDNLFVSGQAETLARVRQFVQESALQIARPLQVEVALWDGTGGEAPPAMLDPGEFARTIGNRKQLWRSMADTRSGIAVALDQQRWTDYVRDVDVEVAQKVTIGQPVVDAFADGGRVVVRPHSLVGGDDLVVHVQFGLAQKRGAVRTHQTGVPSLGDLEIPTLETAYGACSGRIRNGGALAITMRGHASGGGQVILTIRVTGRTPPPGPGSARLGIFPCGALTSGALTQRISPPSPYPQDDYAEVPLPHYEDGPGILEAEQLQDLLRSALGADAENDETFSLLTSGGLLLVRGNERVVPRVEALLRGLQDRLLHAHTVRHTAHLAPVDADAANDTNRTVLHEIVFPTMAGRFATLCRTFETNAVRALHVEIAQEAAIMNPAVATLQSGSWLRTRVGDTGQGHHMSLLAQCVHTVPPQSRNVIPTGGSLMLPETGSTRTHHDGAVGKGQAIEHGDGPLVTVDGRSFRSTLTTTVSW